MVQELENAVWHKDQKTMGVITETEKNSAKDRFSELVKLVWLESSIDANAYCESVRGYKRIAIEDVSKKVLYGFVLNLKN